MSLAEQPRFLGCSAIIPVSAIQYTSKSLSEMSHLSARLDYPSKEGRLLRGVLVVCLHVGMHTSANLSGLMQGIDSLHIPV